MKVKGFGFMWKYTANRFASRGQQIWTNKLLIQHEEKADFILYLKSTFCLD